MHCGPAEMDGLRKSALLLPDISTSTGNAVTAREIQSCSRESLGEGGIHGNCDGWGGDKSDRDFTSLTVIHLALGMDGTVTREAPSALSSLEKSLVEMPEVCDSGMQTALRASVFQ